MRRYIVSEAVDQLRRLGVTTGGVLLVHTSFRAARPIEHGPLGLIAALTAAVGPDGTLVMPSWTGTDDEPFDSEVTPCDPDLGIVAELFRQQAGVARGRHPFAFSAKGPKAAEIVGDPIALPPNQHASPVGRVFDLDGQILLIGVDHDANTTIHMCELMAGVPYRRRKRITLGSIANAVRVDYLENDHCCQRFCFANDWLVGPNRQSEGLVANAASKLMRSRALVEAVTSRLRVDPLAFVHPREFDCAECRDAWASVRV